MDVLPGRKALRKQELHLALRTLSTSHRAQHAAGVQFMFPECVRAGWGSVVLTGVARAVLGSREGSGGEVQPASEKGKHHVAMHRGHTGPGPGSRGQPLVRQPGPERDLPQSPGAERASSAACCALASGPELGSQLGRPGNFMYWIPAHPKAPVSLPEAPASLLAPTQKARAPGLATKKVP